MRHADRKKPKTLTEHYIQTAEKARERRSQMSKVDVIVVDELLERAMTLVVGKKGQRRGCCWRVWSR